MVIAKTPNIVKALYAQLIWEIPNEENKIYLTFDDGPTPQVTNWVMDLLAKNSIRATFFCVGKNVEQHPDIFNQLKDQGHKIGNHSYSHISGWKSNNEFYFDDVEKCQQLVKSNLFRPPYGRITRSQANTLKSNYQLMMWNVLSGDYSNKITPEKCLANVTENTKSGSIIVFHDSVKAKKNLAYALPKSIDFLLGKGFKFDTL